MRIGILGYGNLGRGVECAIKQNPDMELVAVFTRRAPEMVSILTKTAAVCSVADVEQWKDTVRRQCDRPARADPEVCEAVQRSRQL